MLAKKKATFHCYGGGASVDGEVSFPDSRRLFSQKESSGGWIPRGAGMSLVDASYGSESCSLVSRNFDRILSFDEKSGYLRAEAGLTLGQLNAFATSRGWHLSVQPGYPGITIGGCIAANSHGKNPYSEGSFYNILRSIELFGPGSELCIHEKGSLGFELSCGGFGLTGFIYAATIELKKLPSKKALIKTFVVEGLMALPDALLSYSDGAELLYSWHDFARRDRHFGKGVIKVGRFLREEPFESLGYQWTERDGGYRNLGANGPCLFNSWTAAALNRCLFIYEGLRTHLIVDVEDMMFPVKGRLSYYYLFGKKGVIEMQWILPLRSWADFARFLEEHVKSANLPITLASAKLFSGEKHYLRFSGDGICFAMNVPHDTMGLDFAKKVDDLCLSLGGIPNIIKDIRVSKDVVKKAFPSYDSFVEDLNRFWPDRPTHSELSDRLGIT